MPSFQELFSNSWGVILAVLFFGGAIFVHELGHFLAARWRGLKVERFSIGMGPRVFGWTGKDGVDYRISLLPLGGYVALPQMADMSAVEGATDDQAERLPPISYADKMYVAVAGAVFNVLFALFLAVILWRVGTPVQEGAETTLIGHVETVIGAGGPLADIGAGRTLPGPGVAAGLKAGDRILAVDGASVSHWQQVSEAILLGKGRTAEGAPSCTLTIERNGEYLEITALPELVPSNSRTSDRIRVLGLQPQSSVILGEPIANSPAQKGGLRKGDRVLSVDGQVVRGPESFRQLLRSAEPGARQFVVEREDGTQANLAVTPQAILRTNPVVAITHGETGEERVVLIPVPVEGQEGKYKLVVLSATGTPEVTQALQLGAVLDKANGREIVAIHSAEDLIDAAAPNGRDFQIFWSRAGSEGNVTLRAASVRVIQPAPIPSIGADIQTRRILVHRTPFEQAGQAFRSTVSTLDRLIDRDSNIQLNQLMGAIGIAKMYVTLSDDFRLVLWFSVIININLAILNLLPIPVLDGGHMLQATVERLIRRSLPSRLVIWTQYVFVGALMGLMAYVLLNDVRRCSGDGDARLSAELLQRHVVRTVEFK